MADSELTEDAVRNFLLASGGKSTNHDLVTHFKPFLSDAENKAKNREKFKEIVNTLSSVKMGDNNTKYLILKKKYRGSSVLTDSNLSLSSLLGSTTSLSELLGAAQGTLPASSDGSNNTNAPNCPLSTTDASAVSSQSNHRAMSEPPSVQQTPSSPMEISIEVPTQPTTDDGISKCKSETNLRNSKVTEFRDSNSTISSSSLTSTASEEEIIDAPPTITSVKDRAKHLNKLQSESDLQKITFRKYDKSKHEKGKDTSEHDDDSTANFESLTPEQKEWLVTASTGDYQAISKLLSKNPQLAKERVSCSNCTLLFILFLPLIL
ncbi:unnamed protein product [Acanthosepion pharaonis]|uniref:SOWAHA-C winged helix-turn-helix domain-containing protein n=1 Tax=Acanthosepion pharaonis TaxID=158019 RepID=A0A812DY20_ACAPH|nr:unnamed protein product [Sepia pharaonis]